MERNGNGTTVLDSEPSEMGQSSQTSPEVAAVVGKRKQDSGHNNDIIQTTNGPQDLQVKEADSSAAISSTMTEVPKDGHGSIIVDSTATPTQTLPGSSQEPIIKTLSLQDVFLVEQPAEKKSEATPIQESHGCPATKDDDALPIKTETETETNNSQQTSMQSAYHLKKIKFQEGTVLIVTQNENGPCPLIAIVNILLLKGKIKLPVKVELFETVTSEELLNYLGDCILESTPKNLTEADRHNYERNREDAMAVLHKLQTGLDVNINFNGSRNFEFTSECAVFDLLGINLYHGWLVDPGDPAEFTIIGNCSYNQLVEKVINYKQSNTEEAVREALMAEKFLEETASQLTCHGLKELASTIKQGELCVFFRNNHFSTLYKQDDQLFVLVTDQGFLTESTVVWQTLSNVRNDEQFVDSEFRIHNQPGEMIETRSPETKEMRKQEVDDLFLEHIAGFIEQQKKEEAPSGQQLVTTTSSDPFTGGSRYVPGKATDADTGGFVDPFTGGERYIPNSDPTQPAGRSASSQQALEEKPADIEFPKTSFYIFDQGNISNQILGKIKQFNQATASVQDSEIELLEELATGLISSSEEEDQLETLMTLLGWPEDKVFPVLDVLRLAVRYQATNSYMFSDEQAQSTLDLLLSFLGPDSRPANKRLSLKVLCNAFSCRAGLAIMSKECDKIAEKLQGCVGSKDRNIDIALASVLLNYSVLHHLNNNQAAKVQCLSMVSEIVGSVSDATAVFRYLVCVGTLVAGSDTCCNVAKSKGLPQFVKTCVMRRDQPEISKCAGQLVSLFK